MPSSRSSNSHIRGGIVINILIITAMTSLLVLIAIQAVEVLKYL